MSAMTVNVVKTCFLPAVLWTEEVQPAATAKDKLSSRQKDRTELKRHTRNFHNHFIVDYTGAG
jgi:hypothetical protein